MPTRCPVRRPTPAKKQAVLHRIVMRAKRAITADVRAGVVPRSVRTVGGLGKYVDQNMYFLNARGNFDPEVEAMQVDLGRGEVDQQPMYDFLTLAMDRVEAWMKAGGLARIPAARRPALKRTRNPSDESPYEVGVRVGRMNAETALESLDDGTMELDDGETRADRVREYAEIASFEQSDDGAEFYDHPEKNGGRYTWEDFERGVRRGIDLALDRDRPVRNPVRKRRPNAKRPVARRAPKRRR